MRQVQLRLFNARQAPFPNPHDPRSAYGGEPLLPVAPFRQWLTTQKRLRQASNRNLAAEIGVSERTVRRWLNGTDEHGVRDTHVEAAGLALDGSPNLTAYLYPELEGEA